LSAVHILLVDDDDDIREIATISLEAVGGWQVSAASSGAEGIATAIAGSPDAILLDVMMPDMDGPTTFRRLQDDAQTRDIPVIFLTAKAHTADRQRLEQSGVAGLLTKPFDPMTLSAEVAAILAAVGEGTAEPS
jgi:CheY-like chemotaxis protein